MPATWKDLKDDYGPDDGVASIPFEDLNKIARVLNSIYSDAGEIERTPSGRGWRIPILNAGLAKYMAENFADKANESFIANMSNSPDDGTFYEVEWRESDSTWNSLSGGRTGIAFQAQGGDGLDDDVIFECIQSTSTTGNIVYTYFEQFDAPDSNREALQIGLDGARKIARWVNRLVQN
jgi:hypothetical protein